MLGQDELRQTFPGISREVRHGLLVPGNGFTVNPQRIVATLAERFLAEGGEIITERVMKLIPGTAGNGFMVMTNLSNRTAARVVVAAGAWSSALIAPLGVRVALETERGYHAMLPAPNIAPPMPIGNKSRGFGLTPMEHGIRVAGTVEIAGLAAPPGRPGLFLASGHGHFGMTGGPPSGKLVAALIMGKPRRSIPALTPWDGSERRHGVEKAQR